MAYKPTIETRDGYVLVTHASDSGGNTEPTVFARELAAACDSAKLHRVLLDERNLTYAVTSMTELMEMGNKLLDEMLVFRFHKLACVTTPEQLPTAKDFEAIAHNRGMNYRAFKSMEDAERWLRGG